MQVLHCLDGDKRWIVLSVPSVSQQCFRGQVLHCALKESAILVIMLHFLRITTEAPELCAKDVCHYQNLANQQSNSQSV